MIEIKLIRVCSSESGTFGVMMIDDMPLCVTCEDPWRENERNISCIPKGVYSCVPHNGGRFKNVWEIKNVPGRDAVLIHNGNTIKDTEGCILVGKGFGFLNELPSITESIITLNMLRGRSDLSQGFTLRIE